MAITPVKKLFKATGEPIFVYRTEDGSEFFDIDEAIEYDNKYVEEHTASTPVTYDYVWSIQEAINMAVKENRVVRFIWEKSNEEIRKDIVDLKNCKIMKRDREAKDMAVIPPGIEDFVF
ncbi:MAG: hypothetical protein WCY09_09885 [Candidatus Omnitrophota bacterium]